MALQVQQLLRQVDQLTDDHEALHKQVTCLHMWLLAMHLLFSIPGSACNLS